MSSNTPCALKHKCTGRDVVRLGDATVSSSCNARASPRSFTRPPTPRGAWSFRNLVRTRIALGRGVEPASLAPPSRGTGPGGVGTGTRGGASKMGPEPGTALAAGSTPPAQEARLNTSDRSYIPSVPATGRSYVLSTTPGHPRKRCSVGASWCKPPGGSPSRANSRSLQPKSRLTMSPTTERGCPGHPAVPGPNAESAACTAAVGVTTA